MRPRRPPRGPSISGRWSGADRAFVAAIPTRPGGLARGDTQESALTHLNQALPRWIDPAREHADPVPEPKGQCLLWA